MSPHAPFLPLQRKVEFQGRHKSEQERLKEEAELPTDKYEIMEAIVGYLQPQESVAAVSGLEKGGGE